MRRLPRFVALCRKLGLTDPERRMLEAVYVHQARPARTPLHGQITSPPASIESGSQPHHMRLERERRGGGWDGQRERGRDRGGRLLYYYSIFECGCLTRFLPRSLPLSHAPPHTFLHFLTHYSTPRPLTHMAGRQAGRLTRADTRAGAGAGRCRPGRWAGTRASTSSGAGAG